jgi:hypothetical protein
MNLDNRTTFKTKIEYVKYEWLKTLALKNLGIKNINHLRDRFEGQAYFNNFLIRSYGEITLERYLTMPFIDSLRKENERNYTPSFKINTKKISLIVFTFGENPKILKRDFDLAIFIVVNLENRTGEILGFLNRQKLIELIDRKVLSPLDEKSHLGVFKTFEELLPIKELSL